MRRLVIRGTGASPSLSSKMSTAGPSTSAGPFSGFTPLALSYAPDATHYLYVRAHARRRAGTCRRAAPRPRAQRAHRDARGAVVLLPCARPTSHPSRAAHARAVYYNGDNGVGPNTFSLTLVQALATDAGWDPVRGRGSSCTDAGASGQCVVPWAGGAKGVSSVVLVSNGVSFAGRGVLSSSRCAACIERRAQIITLVFTTVGSIADYGGFGRYVLLFFTVVSWAALPCSSPFIIGFCLANG
jgi:hypothetical protein